MEGWEGLELLANVAVIVAAKESVLNEEAFLGRIPNKKRSSVGDNRLAVDTSTGKGCEFESKQEKPKLKRQKSESGFEDFKDMSTGNRCKFESEREKPKVKRPKLESSFQDLKAIRKNKPTWSLQTKSPFCFKLVRAM
ncbi:hypothetical protein JCGZ_25681 [Jatropha curcas]|uniref:Uncharacterized protein n=1 Tax=Jatropha curcas TaxID=180498 RepID=A0A067LFI9_JATCU|nr:hypothetical protein JCGZ_25681 [Jatropha curcas]